jgi:cation transport ATPase
MSPPSISPEGPPRELRKRQREG